jgi:hypothetical protein
MSRLLSKILILHWAVVFTLLAALVVIGGGGGAADGLRFVGISGVNLAVGDAVMPAVTAIFGVCFAFCALLFWWALASVALSGSDERDGEGDVVRVAFAAAAAVLTIILVIGAVQLYQGLFPLMAAHLAAMVASYVAICAERDGRAKVPTEEGAMQLAARVRALDATRTATISIRGDRRDGSRSFER